MSHSNHIQDGINKDLIDFTRDEYLAVSQNWVDPYGVPQVIQHDGVWVVRDDMIVGSKCRVADLFMRSVKEYAVVYVVPRVGLAGISIAEIAKKYNKRVVFFMPASKKISDHQAICIEKGAEVKFRKIAAMPVLNKYAKDWAEENGACFIPLGLKHPLVTAAFVRVCENITAMYGVPDHVFCATSTGVLTRALQIGWPTASFTSVCVARNMKAGELGRAAVISEPLPFQTKEKEENLPPFPSVRTYDAKVYKYAKAFKEQNPHLKVWMWNVGQDVFPEYPGTKEYIDSQRKWGEFRDDMWTKECLEMEKQALENVANFGDYK